MKPSIKKNSTPHIGMKNINLLKKWHLSNITAHIYLFNAANRRIQYSSVCCTSAYISTYSCRYSDLVLYNTLFRWIVRNYLLSNLFRLRKRSWWVMLYVQACSRWETQKVAKAGGDKSVKVWLHCALTASELKYFHNFLPVIALIHQSSWMFVWCYSILC